MTAAVLSLFLLGGGPPLAVRPVEQEAGVALLVRRRSSSARRRLVAGALVTGAVVGGGAPYVDRRACRVVFLWLPSGRGISDLRLRRAIQCVNGLVMPLD